MMHIFPKFSDGRRKCAFVVCVWCLTLSNIDLCARRAHLIQVKLWASMWTKSPVRLKKASFSVMQGFQSKGMECVRSEFLDRGAPSCQQLFHVNTLTGEALIHVNLCAVTVSRIL